MAHKNIKSAYTDTQSVEQSNRKTKRLSVLHAVQQKAASSFHLQHTHMFLKHCGRTLHFVTNIALPGHPLLTKICLQHRLLKKQKKKQNRNVVEGNSGSKDCFYIKVLTINLLLGHFFFYKEKRKRKSLIPSFLLFLYVLVNIVQFYYTIKTVLAI